MLCAWTALLALSGTFELPSSFRHNIESFLRFMEKSLWLMAQVHPWSFWHRALFLSFLFEAKSHQWRSKGNKYGKWIS